MTDRYRPFTEDELKNGSAEGDDGAEKIAKAREIWKSAIPVHGTDADKYLALRGIDPPFRQMDAVRWHKRLCAAIFPGVDAKGEIRFVQAVFLASTGDAIEENGKKKRSFGVMRGAALVLGNGDPVACKMA